MIAQIVRKIQSAAVSPQTRQVLAERLEAAPDAAPVFFSDGEYRLLRTLIEAVIPESTDAALRIAQQIDARLHAGEGAGWRFASLPPDQDAYRLALAIVDWQMFELASEGTELDDGILLKSRLEDVQEGNLGTTEFPLSLWFEGFKVDVIRFWLADPRTMELLHYDGFADEFAQPPPVDPGVNR